MPNCGGHAAQSEKIRQLMAEGKDHDAIIATFIRDFGGQDILIEPADKGLNRFAWAFPYAIAGFGAIAGVFAVRKWSHRTQDESAASTAPSTSNDDVALQARLDRELENLD
jgi:cytochrome c-type biogenesis protein CcmH/NrfF